MHTDTDTEVSIIYAAVTESESFKGIIRHFWKHVYFLSYQDLDKKIVCTVNVRLALAAG